MIRIYSLTRTGEKELGGNPTADELDRSVLRFIGSGGSSEEQIASYCFDGDKKSARAELGGLLRKNLIRYM